MSRSSRWFVVIPMVACLVGAAVALSVAGPQIKTSTRAVSKPISSPVSAEDARATQSVVNAANRLTVSITRARNETSTVLASSYAALARSQRTIAAERSQLVAEQLQITAEAKQLAARAAALSAEGATLQREAESIKAAQARASANTVPTPSSPGSGASSFGGGQHDN